MRKLTFLIVAASAALFTAGCTGPEQKLGRGLSNTFEIVRWGDLRHSIEQDYVMPKPGVGAYGAVHGFTRSVSRIGLGVVEIVTFPIPPYRAPFPDFVSPDSKFPSSYKPGIMSDSLFETDTCTGFSGGDIAPFVPGSRFTIFGN